MTPEKLALLDAKTTLDSARDAYRAARNNAPHVGQREYKRRLAKASLAVRTAQEAYDRSNKK